MEVKRVEGDWVDIEKVEVERVEAEWVDVGGWKLRG